MQAGDNGGNAGKPRSWMSGDRDTEHAHEPPGAAEASRLASIRSNRFDAAASHPWPAGDMRDVLSDAIRSIVLPRLIAAHSASGRPLPGGEGVTEQDIAGLLTHVTTADHSLAEAMLAVLRLRGVRREDILLDLFEPVARRLGEQWLSDQCSFADVTLGVGRLQRLIRSDSMPAPGPDAPGRAGRILIASLPGEQHTLGVAIIDDIFRSAGWDTVEWTGREAADLEVVAASAPFDIVGVSIGDPRALHRLKPLTGRLRKVASRNLFGILAGGSAFRGPADYPAAYGVDAIVRDARTAVAAARALLER
jgi:MerR family transcriptional regulator, light-induced transcriptional regulator